MPKLDKRYVERAAKWLDKDSPGWFGKVKVQRLWMNTIAFNGGYEFNTDKLKTLWVMEIRKRLKRRG